MRGTRSHTGEASGAGSGRHAGLSAGGAAILVALAACLAYANSFGGLFVMDDVSEVRRNPAMRSLLPPWRAMFVGHRMPARPIPYLSFAVDHAIWADDPFGYHLTNLAIHAAAAVTLFGVVRLTLLSPRLGGRYADRATLLAAIVAAAWAVHPLGTQAVTYVYQRIESLTGLLMLAALYALARSLAGESRRWLALATLATASAMASKETAVVLPVLLAAYDWLFSGEGLAGLRRRRLFYASLAATWLVLAAVLVSQAGRYGEFHEPVHRPLAYLLTQPRVILHYLRLAIVPTPLCFDYVWRTAETPAEFLPSLCWLLVPLGATMLGLVRWRPWAWLGVAFFLLLAPTSSIMPVIALAAEHRMYLPLAAVVATIVLVIDGMVGRLVTRGSGPLPAWRSAAPAAAVVAAVVWIGTLAAMTRARNTVYATPGGIWLDVLAKQPVSTRALWNLAATCVDFGEIDSALRYADEAADINPALPIYRDLAESRRDASDLPTAIRLLEHAVERGRGLRGEADPVVRDNETLLRELRR
ncbi:MAG: hypothetical protein ACKOTB_11875 [Planctomycetia bacterium]